MIIDHIGIIVRDLEKALSLFTEVFGVKQAQIRELPDVGLRIGYLEAENVDIELIEYLSEGESFGRSVMGSIAGLNHISFLEEDLEGTLDRCRSIGAKVKLGFPREGGKGLIAFLEEETTSGILMELLKK